MKIAILGSAHPYRGGIAIYNDRLAKALIEAGHEVVLYNFTLQYPSFLFPGKSQYSEDPAPPGLNIIRCVNSINPFNWLKVGRKIRNSKPDLVIAKFWLPFMGPCLGTILRRIKKDKSIKAITIIDNMVPHESRPGDKIFTQYFSNSVDGFIAMSQAVLDDILLFDKKKPKLLSPHPLYDNFGLAIEKQEARKKLNLNPRDNILLFFGLIRDYKGLDLLIKSFADERFRNKNYKLIVAGEYYADKEVYTNLIDSLKLNDEIIQVDRFIPDSEVGVYFGASDLVVQPYKSATQSGVTQIAYHFNKAMVVTNVGGLPEMCPDGEVGYVTEVDPKSIADGVLRYFESADKEAMILNMERIKKKYSWEILVDNIFHLKDLIPKN